MDPEKLVQCPEYQGPGEPSWYRSKCSSEERDVVPEQAACVCSLGPGIRSTDRLSALKFSDPAEDLWKRRPHTQRPQESEIPMNCTMGYEGNPPDPMKC